MKITRGAHPDRGWLAVDNRLARDRRISDRARGLLIRILSHRSGWETDSSRLAEGTTEGRDAVRSAINELEAAGYWVRVKTQDSTTGRWSTAVEVNDVPKGGFPPDPDSEDGDSGTEDGFSGVGPTDATDSDRAATYAEDGFSGAGSTEDGFPVVGYPVVGYPVVGNSGATKKTFKKNSQEEPLPPHPSDVGARSRADEPQDAPEPSGKIAKRDHGTTARGTRLPVNWRPDPALAAWTLDQGIARPEALREFERFRDYWAAASGARAVKRDWDATWRNWIRKAADDRAERGGRPLTRSQRTDQVMAAEQAIIDAAEGVDHPSFFAFTVIDGEVIGESA